MMTPKPTRTLAGSPKAPSEHRCCAPPPDLAAARLEPESSLFGALADPQRLRILAVLGRAGGEVCVCHLTEMLPVNQPTVSHHLKILGDAGLVTCRKRGTWCYYSLAPSARAAVTAALDRALPPGLANAS